MQAYHVLVVKKDYGLVEGVIIFPRDTQKLEAIGGLYSIGDKGYKQVSAKELPDFLQKHTQHLIAL
jgi:hypothetical protein